MCNYVTDFRSQLRGVLAMSALIAAGFGTQTLHAQPVPGETNLVVDDPGSDASLCYVLSGCLNADHQLIVIRDTVFAGLPLADLTRIAFVRDELTASFFQQFSSVKINIGYSTNGPDSLAANFDANFVPGTKLTVFDGALTLSAPAGSDPQMWIELTTAYPVVPQTGRHLLIEIITSGEGFGDGTQFLDAANRLGDNSSTVTYFPSSSNSRRSGTFDNPTGTPETIAPVVALELHYDPTRWTSFTQLGQSSVFASSFLLLQAINSISVQAAVSGDACLFRDSARDVYDQATGDLIQSRQIPLQWSQVELLDGSCDGVHALLGRIASTHRLFPGWHPLFGYGSYAVVFREAHSQSFGAYTLTDGEVQSYLSDVFHVTLAKPLNCAQQIGATTRALDQVPLIFIAPQDAGPNADDYSGTGQCDGGWSIQPKTVTWFPGRFAHADANYYNNLIQEQIQRMRGAIDAASLCVTPDPTGVLGQLSTTLSELRNAFAGSNYALAREKAEILGYLAQSFSFPGCGEDYQAIITSIAVQIAFALWDDFEHATFYQCYRPVFRNPGDNSTTFVGGFADCTAAPTP